MEFLIIWGVSIVIGCLIADAKGQGASGFLLAFLLGPLGVLIVLALPNENKKLEAMAERYQRHKELAVQQQMLEELKALRAEKAQREDTAQPAPEWIPRHPPPPSVEEFIPESLQGVRRRK